jgi:hypothetical protein
MKSSTRLAVVILIALGALGPRAALPQSVAEFTGKDIGEPGANGLVRVNAAGVFTILGSGRQMWGEADHFFFVSRPVTGDGSLVARLLSQEGGNGTWAKTGVMIRDSDARGARYAMLDMTPVNGVDWQWRERTNQATQNLGGSLAPPAAPLFLRIQRVGNEISGYVSDDGRLWRAVTPSQSILMSSTALFGLAVTSEADGEISTARYDNVSVHQDYLSVGGLTNCAGDRANLLQWKPLPNVLGYHVYRGPATARIGQLARVNADLVTSPSFADRSPGLVNGTTVTYAVAPVLAGPEGSQVEGPPAAIRTASLALPPGMFGCSIGVRAGSAAYDAASGVLSLHSAGGDCWGTADSTYFVGLPMEGNIQITARILGKPTRTNDWAKSGIMLRESLEPGARNVILGVSAANGLWQQWRSRTNGESEWPGEPRLSNSRVTGPILLRLTRWGATIIPEFSTDDGKTFLPSGDAYTYRTGLPATLYLGLFLSANNLAEQGQVRFSDVVVRRL